MLSEIIAKIPVIDSPDLLVGFNGADDGAVFQLSEDIAIIKTLDFFPPLVEDAYIFGQIAACNALSDVFAMGGVPKVALNILAFPEDGDRNYLEALLAGGADKVAEAGCVLGGGHSIVDDTVKYGLSVTGIVHPKKILCNNTGQIGDKIILTKPLGVGIVTSAYVAGEAKKPAFDAAVRHMTTLNSLAMDIAKKYRITAATDITGFGFLGHLNEMVGCNSIVVDSGEIIMLPEAYRLAEEFLTNVGGQKNRNSLSCDVEFNGVKAAMEEILFDPQTSGGLLIALPAEDAEKLSAELAENGIETGIVAEIVPKRGRNIYVY